VPLGIFFGILSVLVLYISVQLVAQGVLGRAITDHKDAPLAAVAGIIFGKAGVVLIIFATSISMLGNLGGEILSIPRIIYAGARDGLMPKIFGKIHPKFFTPHIAVMFYAALGFLFAISGGFKQLAVIASASTLLIYLGVVLSTLKLRKNDSVKSEKTFRVRGGVIIPILAAGAIIWLLSSLTRRELISIAIFILTFSVIYLVTKMLKKNN
ncbi:MAG TPA: amino acid permease, partial [Puia sp.]|nr:amino acid permease [Puia sp.]